MPTKKVVLAYSGGLDTSVAIRWLKDLGWDVIAFTVDLGEKKDLDAIQARALKTGASAAYVADDPRDPNYSKGTSALVQNGGTITLGTSGTPNGTTNTTYGYQNVDTSGAISVASNVLFDVSGGPGGANISNTGGQVILRAPILTNNNVNVRFQGTLVSSANGGPAGSGVVLDAYAVWSTTDTSTGGQHFDGTPALAAQFGCQLVKPISIARHQHQVVAVGGIAAREAFADPGCGPGDQGDAAWHGVSVLSATSRPRRVGRRGKGGTQSAHLRAIT